MKKIAAIVIISVLVLVGVAVIIAGRAYVVPVLMYHSIDHNDKVSKLSVSPESFERQMKFLYDHKYNVVGMDKIIWYLEKKEKTPPRTVAVTFDDGFYNNYKYAYPVLKKYGLPATIFVITDKIGKEGFLGWSEIKEMSDSGLVTIGSHTMSHCWLPDADDAKLSKELSGSKDILEKRLGRQADFICYPVGAHDERVKEACRRAGYRAGLATNPGRFKPSDDALSIKRVRISRTSDNLFVFWIESSGYYTWVKEHRDE